MDIESELAAVFIQAIASDRSLQVMVKLGGTANKSDPFSDQSFVSVKWTENEIKYGDWREFSETDPEKFKGLVLKEIENGWLAQLRSGARGLGERSEPTPEGAPRTEASLSM